MMNLDKIINKEVSLDINQKVMLYTSEENLSYLLRRIESGKTISVAQLCIIIQRLNNILDELTKNKEEIEK